MKNGLTIISKSMVYLMVVAVFTVLTILLPELAREERVANPNAGPTYPFFIGAWILTIPVFIALNETLKILNYVNQGTAFSKLSVRAIQKIKICAAAFGTLIVIGAMTIIIVGRNIDPSEDLTPVASIGFIFTFTSIVIATFAATLQKLLEEALHIKEENDLTV